MSILPANLSKLVEMNQKELNAYKLALNFIPIPKNVMKIQQQKV